MLVKNEMYIKTYIYKQKVLKERPKFGVQIQIKARILDADVQGKQTYQD